MSLVDFIKDQVSGEVLHQVGAVLGESPEQSETAVGASIPAILAALGKLVAAPGGADLLQNTINAAKLPGLGDLVGMLGGDVSGLITKGASLIPAIFGGGPAADVLIGLISKFGGISAENSKKLLGYLLPVILASISSKIGTRGVQGLTALFQDEKATIAEAFPQGLTLEAIPELLEPKASRGSLKWLLVVTILGGIAIAAYYLMPAAEPAVPDIAVPAGGESSAPTSETPTADPAKESVEKVEEKLGQNASKPKEAEKTSEVVEKAKD